MPKKSKTREKKRKVAGPRRRGVLRAALKLGVVTLLLWGVVGLGYYVWALQFDLKKIHEMDQRSVVFDYQGQFYSRLAGENRIVVPFDKVSNDFVNALISREDTRFYTHHGVDPIGVSRAVVRNLILGGFREGASTITQQLARNSFPLGGKNLHRKLIEAALAFRIETELTKEEILEAYMNRIYFGSGTYGVEAASQTYFGRPASRLSLSEAATLAGLIRSPSRFSPLNDPKKSVRERNVVLQRMCDIGLITRDQRDDAQTQELVTIPRPQIAPEDNWAMDAILRDLDMVLEPGQMDAGGLKIYSTIDGSLQDAAEESVARRLREIEAQPGYPHQPAGFFEGKVLDAEKSAPYLEAAALAMDSKSGGIRAIVGGRNYHRSKFHRALFGHRQIGSTVKPFVYAEAFERGLKPSEPVDDGRLSRSEIPSRYGAYNPANSDGTYLGNRPAGDGLVFSRNTMTVRIGLRAGIDNIAKTIILAGLSKNPPRYPSLCLGTFETNLKDLTAAYTIFPTGGYRLQPYIIEKVTDADGHVLYKSTGGRLRVFSPQSAKKTTELLEEVIARGTAARAQDFGLRGFAAGKTGTTNNFVDAWFLGFDTRLTCGVWVGFDQPRTIRPGGYGATLALPIWVDIIQAEKKSAR
ncbi:MAG: PBP1A family penicillin-binding protein [Chthoniobacterales bacterium]|nr:PBP1A family penicillin-binding protein [Chthoniobacterales bacterium]